MEKARWIWYPGDFELYHFMLVHTRRQENGFDYPSMWYVPRPELLCTFEKDVTLEEDTEITVAAGERYEIFTLSASDAHKLIKRGEGDLYVGRVTSVSPHTAEVALLSDASVRVSCEVVSDAGGRAHGILSGGGPDGLQLRHLSSAAHLRPQARVMTSGLGGVVPRGLAVGTLLQVTNDVRGVEGEVRPCVDFSTLEDVFIRRDQ